jgi:hypothetical protein
MILSVVKESNSDVVRTSKIVEYAAVVIVVTLRSYRHHSPLTKTVAAWPTNRDYEYTQYRLRDNFQHCNV